MGRLSKMEEFKKLEVKTQVFDILKKRIGDLENEIQSLKNKNEYKSAKNTPEKNIPCRKCDKTFSATNDFKRHEKMKHNQIKCKSCEKVFFKNSDLEIYLEQEHKAEKFKCEQCEKMFVLKWRLNKHEKIHSSQNVKKCHYFNNEKICPFEQIGCMFEHSLAGQCRDGDQCKRKLCSFEHKNIRNVNNETNVTENVSNQIDEMFDLYVKTNFPEIFELYLANQNLIPCYFCDYTSKNETLRNIKNEITRHMETDHEDIISVFNSDNMEIENALHLEFVEFFIAKNC